MYETKELGTIICELRESKGVTQNELAVVLGVAEKTISAWESNILLPDVQAINEIARYFSVNVGDLIERKIFIHKSKGKRLYPVLLHLLVIFLITALALETLELILVSNAGFENYQSYMVLHQVIIGLIAITFVSSSIICLTYKRYRNNFIIVMILSFVLLLNLLCKLDIFYF